MLYDIVVLKNFGKFTGKQLRWSLFLGKLQAIATGFYVHFWTPTQKCLTIIPNDPNFLKTRCCKQK